jgi:hypothetical protein
VSDGTKLLATPEHSFFLPREGRYLPAHERGRALRPGNFRPVWRPALALVMTLCVLACEREPPLAEASRTARDFLEAFSTGDHDAALRLATGDVLHGVEVARANRERDRRDHPAEVALLEKAMRAHPPDVQVRAPRRHTAARGQPDDTAEIRAVVTTVGPGGPERVQYELWLVWREPRWLVYRWGRIVPPAGARRP